MINLNKQSKETIKHYIGLTLLVVFNLLDFFASLIGWMFFVMCLFGYVTFTLK